MDRTQIPNGKGLFLWQIRMVKPLYPSDAQVMAAKVGSGARVKLGRLLPQSSPISTIVQAALDLGLDWVAPKVSNGIYKYNLRWNGVGWVDDWLHPLVKEFQSVGIKVHGWQYIYAYSGFAERYAQQAIDRTLQLGLDGFMINAEHQYKGKAGEAEKYCVHLRAGLPNHPIGISSYRYPSYHPTFPMSTFARHCDYHSPQVYWLGAHNPREQLERTIDELNKIKAMPIIPVGLGYTEGGYAPPTDAEMDEFHQAVLDNNLPGNLWWEWWRLSLIGKLGVVARHKWPNSNEPPPNDEIEFPLPPFNLENASYTQGIQLNRDAINHITQEAD